MAKPDLEVKVSIEKAIHVGLQTVFQEIWDEHQICVKSVKTDWLDASGPGHPSMQLLSLDLVTTTKL
jgi:hypothetical protein